MSIAEIKDEAKELSSLERRELVTYLVHLEEAVDPAFMEEMTRKADEREKFTKWSDIKGDFVKD